MASSARSRITSRVKYGALPKGELYGLICKHSVIGCGTDVRARKIVGATVTLDDGRSVDAPMRPPYDFLNVTPRLACVTVKKTGFLTKTQCHQVDRPAQLNYNSVAMWEGTDPPDAGVDGCGRPRRRRRRATHRPATAGNGYDGPGWRLLRRGARSTTMPPRCLVLVAWFLTRRRGTTA